jgi:ADP-ribosyl-[dinitrogen reductase] hydrolase
MRGTLDKYKGCLIGLAAGDALGTTVEFRSPGSFPTVMDMVGGGVFDLQPGQWTDDTSMALCIAESLLSVNGFDPVDQMTRYRKWMRHGYMSSTGECFDVGNATREAILRFEKTGDGEQPIVAIQFAAESSKTTHATSECIDACRLFAAFIIAALQGWSKERMFEPFDEWLENGNLAPKIEEIGKGPYRFNEPPYIKGTGYVVKSLEAALWAFAKSTSFEEGALLAVNLGDDADTTGAIYGQLAGAYYGYKGIPSGWVKKLAMREMIEKLAQRLYENAGGK